MLNKKSTSLIAFGILLGSIITIYGWSGFENPFFLVGETKQVTGKVIEVFPSEQVKTYSRRIKYVYTVEEESFIDFKKLGTQDDKQFIGNSLQVSYSVKNPKNNKITKLFNDKGDSNGLRFYTVEGEGYTETKLLNGIFRYKENIPNRKPVDDLIGEYYIEFDTLYLNHYCFKSDSTLTIKPEYFVAHPNSGNKIIEMPLNRIFTKIESKRR